MTEDISIAQRMVSATCGSILTSLLGEYLDLNFKERNGKSWLDSL